MISKLMTAFAAFCVATVITQMIIGGYLLGTGRLDQDAVIKVVALVNGIDISGQKLQRIFGQSGDREQPDFEEILEARKLDGLDIDMRLKSQQAFRDELNAEATELQLEREQFNRIKTAFRSELEEIQKGVQKKGLSESQRILQNLEAEQAKEQLLFMYDDERIDDVVTIIQAMPPDKRKDILAEFVSNEEKIKLADLLKRITNGQPTSSLIDAAVER